MDHSIKIRAHHGMCLAFYKGKGYSSQFTQHITWLKQNIKPDSLICVVDELDEICSACPNHKNGICTDQEKVVEYDHQVLLYCGLQSGTVLSYGDFQKIIQQKIFAPGKREQICGNCQWTELCHF